MSWPTVGLGGTVILGVVTAASLQAQSLAVPAEFPPTSYTGTQYVDSTGCAYVRAGNAALVNWVPRVSRSREQLCGFVPTSIAGDTAAFAPTGPLILFDDPVAAPSTAASQPEAAQSSAAEPQTFAQVCEGKFGVQSGFLRANGDPVDCGPAPVVAAVVAPTPLPAPVRILDVAPAAVAIPTPVPAAVVEPIAPAPPRVTRAQACEGKFGVQTGFVTSAGDPVDCGPAPEIAVAAVSVPVAATPEPGPRRVSLTKICAEIAATGKRVINAATGQPVVCPEASVVTAGMPAQNMAPAAPGRPVAVAVPAAPSLQAPVTALVVQQPVVTAAAPRRTLPAVKLPFTSPDVPASNPTPASVANETIRPPAGYEPVWKDGRINPNRGIRKISLEDAVAMGLVSG